MLPVVQGRIGLVNAIRDLTMMDYVVSVPLVDNQPYDLVVEIDGILNKVSVKSTRSKSNTGYPTVQVGDIRSNKTTNVVRKFDPSKSDYLYIYAIGVGSWLIPSNCVLVGRMLTVDSRFDRFRISC